jgi:hypothetical protein
MLPFGLLGVLASSGNAAVSDAHSQVAPSGQAGARVDARRHRRRRPQLLPGPRHHPFSKQGGPRLPAKRQVSEFLARDFSQEPHRAAACKNAFHLLAQHRHHLAAAFFLLGASPAAGRRPPAAGRRPPAAGLPSLRGLRLCWSPMQSHMAAAAPLSRPVATSGPRPLPPCPLPAHLKPRGSAATPSPQAAATGTLCRCWPERQQTPSWRSWSRGETGEASVGWDRWGRVREDRAGRVEGIRQVGVGMGRGLGLSWAGLGWAGLGWAGLGWHGMAWHVLG